MTTAVRSSLTRSPPRPMNRSRAIVEALASHGARVHTCARTEADVDACVAEWRARGLDVTGSACDVSSRASRADLCARASDLFRGKVDILVSNVGFNTRKPTVDFTPEEYRALMDVNLESSFALCQLFHPLLVQSRDGCVLFNSSVASLVSMQSGVVYAMTKAAMNMLTKYLACEWAKDGIRVNAVAPWYINTPLAKQVSLFQSSFVWAIILTWFFLMLTGAGGSCICQGCRRRDARGTRRGARGGGRGERVPVLEGGELRHRSGSRD